MTDRRDRAIDALLARRPPGGGERTSGVCLDPDTVAAWFDGALPADARAAAEAHAGSCARCQSLLAVMARTEPVGEVPGPWWRTRRMRWLVPAMAAAAAVALWVAVLPHDRVLAPSAPVETANARDAVSKVAPSEERKQPSREAPGKAAAASPPPAAKNELSRPTAKLVPPPAGADKRPVARPDAAAPADAKPSAPPESLLSRARAAQAPSPAAAADSAFRQNRLETVTVPVEIASPDPASRWRVRPDGAIEHSSDSGATWTPQGTSPPSTVTSGAAPSRTVAWFVGRGGLVLLTADGVTWQRRDVGEPVDLVSVRPVDDKTATVVAADGRQFTTHDAGVTWTPARLQEIPAASF